MDQLTREKCARKTCPNLAPSGYGGWCQKHARHLGVVRKKVSADPSRKIIRNLLDQGWTINEIAVSAGMSRTSVRNVLVKGHPNVRQATHDALHRLVPRREWVPSWRAGRRVRALRAAGFRMDELTVGMGTTRSVIAALSGDMYETTTVDLFGRVDAFYRAHEADPVRPASPKTARRKWPLPMDWIDIDDPGEQRGLLTAAQRRDSTPLSPDVVAIATWLVDFWGSIQVAAETCGLHETVLGRIAGGRQPKVAREFVRRIEHAARREGWFPGIETQAVAA